VLAFLLSGVASAQSRRQLHDGWLVQSSDSVGLDGTKISSRSYQPKRWYRATTPSTVVGALVEAGVHRDPFFGMNLRSLPGMTYPIGANFVHTAMAPGSPFAVP
jgi:exo-1,4-beta-D-glucosaminidase